MANRLAIVLLRHGITAENTEKKFIGWTDTTLSPYGQNQLICRSQDTYPTPDHILCSDLARCIETYKMLYPNSNIPITYSSYWRELSFGKWEQKSHDDLRDDQIYQNWLQDWSNVQIPEGESYATFSNRVTSGFEEAKQLLLTKAVKQVVIITHGGPIRKILSDYAPVKREFWDWKVEHGEGFLLTTTPERLRRNERCISLVEVPFKGKENG